MSPPQLAAVGQDSRDYLVVVALHRSGRHVGLLITEDEEADPVFIHLTGHHRFCSVEEEGYICNTLRWVVPSLTSDALARVVILALAIQEHYAEGRMPYGFDPTDAHFTEEGALLLQGGCGLTCASFVAVVFSSVGLPLVDLQSWMSVSTERRTADRRDQRALIESLGHAGASWTEQVSQEVGRGPWLRAVEIAAASGMLSQPVVWADAEPAGERLRAQLQASGTEL